MLLAARIAALLVMALPAAFGESFRLYLKDGGHHLVREYQVAGDRVRYYSTERSDWEEIPLVLIDVEKTEAERKAAEAKRAAEVVEQEAEDRAERDMVREIRRVPAEPGVYLVEGDKLRTMTQAEVAVVTDKKRNILKNISPVPLINGKATLEATGEQSKTVLRERRPEFYLRLNTEERFGIVRLTPKKGARIVEKIVIVPVVNEKVEEQDPVETFRRQFGEGLFKLWPTKDLDPGEYAVVQFTEGKVNVQVWDFRVE